MRIGLVSFAWTDQHGGGLRSHVQDLAHDLAELGDEVIVHCVNTDPSQPPFETRSWKEGRIHVHELNYAYQNSSTLFDFQSAPQIETILTTWAEREQPDLIHIHHNLFIGMGATPALAAHAPTVTSLHDYWPLDPCGQLFDGHSGQSITSTEAWEACAAMAWPHLIQRSHGCHNYFSQAPFTDQNKPADLRQSWVNYSRTCLSSSQTLITPSKASASIFRTQGIKQPITVIENGINTNNLANGLHIDHGLGKTPEGPIKLAVLGNITPPKGQLAFCKACLKLPIRKQLKISLHGSFPSTYHGDKSSQEALEKLWIGHPDLVEYKGNYERTQLRDILASNDLAVVPSIWEEVYGLVARECLCYGLPLITTTAGGLAELQNVGNVLILNHQNPDRWHEFLHEAFENGPLMKWIYHRRQGLHNSIHQPRSSMDCCLELRKIYADLLNPQAKAPALSQARSKS